MTDRPPSSKPLPDAPVRRPWIAPTVTELPPLTKLTLISGDPISGGGGPGGGGSTVF